MPGGGQINPELSRTDLQGLLASFLIGTQGVTLQQQITDISELPEGCRARVRDADLQGRAWTAWVTELGIIAAWGELDLKGSRALNAYLLHIGWFHPQTGDHGLWCYSDPKRPTEWVVGRGQT
jgi:hypothetical protein